MEHALQLETTNFALQTLRVRVDVASRTLIALTLGELQELGGVRNPFAGAVDLFGVGGQAGAFASELLSPLGLGPNGRVFELATDFLEALFLVVVLKETPVGTRCVPRGL